MWRSEDIVALRDHHRSHADIIEFSNGAFYSEAALELRRDTTACGVLGRMSQPFAGYTCRGGQFGQDLAELLTRKRPIKLSRRSSV